MRPTNRIPTLWLRYLRERLKRKTASICVRAFPTVLFKKFPTVLFKKKGHQTHDSSLPPAKRFELDNTVKLVIWDLDDTFWRGTLSEQQIEPIQKNIDIVLELSRRGIINSICSKNDPAQAKAELERLGIYEHFVFPTISFAPKGGAVARIIEDAALRVENVLFIDDNSLNLEEVKFFNPGIMACHPREVLHELLAHPNLVGKSDPELSRLKQYQSLQKKIEQRSTSTLSNEDFLRASNIQIQIDPDVEANFERVVELVNRSNQLNYTKKRLETQEALDDFGNQLKEFGCQAGCVRVVDKFGDYGLAGFFLMRRRAGIKQLIHFAFSCRAMHMGVEQYIYEMLGRPDITTVEPISYGLDVHSNIDWIGLRSSADEQGAGLSDRQLLLLGGCDLLQLASYCTANRIEFVNKMQDKIMVRYDDPGFIVSDRAAIRDCESIRKIPLWTYEDAVFFDESVATSELMLVSLWPAMRGSYYSTSDGILLHFPTPTVRDLKKLHPRWLGGEVELVKFDIGEKLKLIIESLDSIAQKSRPDAEIFLLGCYTRAEQSGQARGIRCLYNYACRTYCTRNSNRFRFVDVDEIVPLQYLIDTGHFVREGYFLLAQHILGQASALSARVLNAA